MEEKNTKMAKLAFIRKQRGYSQAKLAKACGWKQATISHYESGERSPNIQKLKKIAEVLGVSIGDLI